MSYFYNFYLLLTRRQRRDFYIVAVVCILASIGEFLSVGAIIPLIVLLVAGESVGSNFFSDYISVENLPSFFLILVIACIVASNILAIAALFFKQRYVKRVKSHFASKLFHYYLHLPVSQVRAVHSNDLVSNINGLTAKLVNGALGNIITLISKLSAAVFILVVLLLAQSVVALFAGVLLSSLYIGVYFFFKKRIAKTSQTNTVEMRSINRFVSDCVRSIHIVGLNNLSNKLSESFRERERRVGLSIADLNIFKVVPRYIIEMGGIIFMVVTVFFMKIYALSLGEYIGTLTIFGVGFFRLLPALQNSYHSYSGFFASQAAYKLIKRDLELALTFDSRELDESEVQSDWLNGKVNIEMVGINYRYPDQPLKVFEDMSLHIRFSGFVGLRGASGKGKSTLISLILGLDLPQSGTVIINKQTLDGNYLTRWWENVSYISQNDYILDDSIFQNIVLYDDEVDQERLNLALHISGFDSVINLLPDGVHSNAGENASFFSGGQKQRLALARALYQKKKYLILDEAFSAIDISATKEIINKISALGQYQGIMLVSHREEEMAFADSFLDL